MKPVLVLAAALIVLGACSDRAPGERGDDEGRPSGATGLPETLLGTWGADCARPEIRLAPGTIHVFAEDATWPLTGAEAGEDRLVLRYDGANGPVEETYAVGEGTLALVEGVYDGGPVVWNRPPMRPCPAT